MLNESVFHRRCSKKELIDVLLKPNSIEPQKIQRRDITAPTASNIDVYWLRDNAPFPPFPTALVLDEGDILDFFAWVNTYLPQLSPITSLVHVHSFDEFMCALDSSKHILPPQFKNIITGIILSELYLLNGFKKPQNNCSFFRIYNQFAGNKNYLEVAKIIFTRCRHCYDLFDYESIASFDDIIPIIDFLHEPFSVQNTGLFSKYSQHDFNRTFDLDYILSHDNNSILKYDLPGKNQISSLPKDKRYNVLKDVINKLSSKRDSSSLFTIAYLVNMISPGSMANIEMLDHLKLPAQAYFWYGVCAGTSSEGFNPTNLLKNYIQVSIELIDTVEELSRPTCDFSIYEAVALFDGVKLQQEFNTNRFFVEIFKDINVQIKDSRPYQYEDKSKNNVELASATDNVYNKMCNQIIWQVNSLRQYIDNSMEEKTKKKRGANKRNQKNSDDLFDRK